MKNKLKQETGSMAAYTIAMIMTFMIILGGIYFSNSALRKNQLKTLLEIKNIYEQDTSKVDEINESLKKQQLLADGSYSELKGINTPKLGNGMIPVKWDEATQKFIKTTGNDKTWYDYDAKKWANAITEDGSYWVWIPRYAYQIASNYHTATAGTINIEFMKGTTNESSSGRTSFQNTSGLNNWNMHPAFNYGQEVPGIWVAKYEASRNNSSTTSEGSGSTMKIQPTVMSWRNITVNDIYNTCLNYNSSLNSHQMKNVEWGAVAYLSKSIYGKGEEEIWINNSSSFITGSAGNSASAVTDEGTTNDYASAQGVKASTTGNVYGVYDMSGGSDEYTAAYINNGNQNSIIYGNSLYTGLEKNKDVYNYNSSGDDKINNYSANSKKYGDAIYETSSNCAEPWNLSWFKDYSYFPYGINLFFYRGEYYGNASGAGAFAFSDHLGNANIYIGFRPVLCAM